MSTNCPTCGEEYDALGIHLTHSDKCNPEISDRKIEILRGILMGDGWVSSSGRAIQAEWANKKYPQYISKELGWVSGDVKERPDRNGIYQLNTISYDQIETTFSKWYKSGEKMWDTSYDLTNEAMRHLYACDGSLKVREGRKSAATIGCANERDRIKRVIEWIDKSGFPRPTSHISNYGVELYFSTDDTPKLLNMFDPVNGYEYKWDL
jgi:hypothetical protein